MCPECNSMINLLDYKGYNDFDLVECNECHMIYHRKCFNNNNNVKILLTSSLCSKCSLKVYNNPSQSQTTTSSSSQLNNILSQDSPEIIIPPTSVIRTSISPPIKEKEGKKKKKKNTEIESTNQLTYSIPIPEPTQIVIGEDDDDDILHNLIPKIMKHREKHTNPPKRINEEEEEDNEIEIFNDLDDDDDTDDEKPKKRKLTNLNNNQIIQSEYDKNNIIYVTEPICQETFKPYTIVYNKYNKEFAMVLPEEEMPNIVRIDYDSCPFTTKIVLITFMEKDGKFQQ